MQQQQPGQKNQKEVYDSKHKPDKLPEGTLVLLENTAQRQCKVPSMAWSIHHQQKLGERGVQTQKHRWERCVKEDKHQLDNGLHLQRWPGTQEW